MPTPTFQVFGTAAIAATAAGGKLRRGPALVPSTAGERQRYDDQSITSSAAQGGGGSFTRKLI